MGGLYCMVTVVRRELGERFMTFYKKNGVRTHMSTLCNGTAQQKTLDYLGLEKTEKMMIISFVSDDIRKKLSHDLVSKMHIDVPGNGIAMTVCTACLRAFSLNTQPIIWMAIRGVSATRATTPKASVIILPPSAVQAPIQSGRRKVEVIGPLATPPESNAIPTKIFGTRRDITSATI